MFVSNSSNANGGEAVAYCVEPPGVGCTRANVCGDSDASKIRNFVSVRGFDRKMQIVCTRHFLYQDDMELAEEKCY